MPGSLRALRGATTVDADDAQQITERVMEMLDALMDRNGLVHDDVVSILFTATDDIHSMFPALPARKAGFGDIPLICARELDIVGGTPRCIRVLVHIETTKARGELRHVYLHGAQGLNDDLPT
jgi:chorismate mutase